MNKLVCRTVAGLAASLAFALPCMAQVSVVGCIFDSTNPQITDDPNRCPADRKLDIVSIKGAWTQTETIGSAGGGAGAGKVQTKPFVIVKNLDRASPALFMDVVTGRHIRGVLIAVFESSNRGSLQRTFSFLLEDAIVSSLEFDAADSRARGASPMDLVEFSYARITVKDEVSRLTSVFDFVANRAQ
jgi:type VI secretion system Hcp family effector